MYVGLGQDALSDWAAWVQALWQSSRGETPPGDLVYGIAQTLVDGSRSIDDVVRLITRQ